MIWFDNSVEWQLWTSVFVIELNFLLLKPTSTPVKPFRFDRKKTPFSWLAIVKKSGFAYKRNLLSSVITNRVGVDVIVCVWSKLVQSLDFNSLGPASFTNYCYLASAERRTFYGCQFHLSLKCLPTRCLVSYHIHHIKITHAREESEILS